MISAVAFARSLVGAATLALAARVGTGRRSAATIRPTGSDGLGGRIFRFCESKTNVRVSRPTRSTNIKLNGVIETAMTPLLVTRHFSNVTSRRFRETRCQ